MGLQAGWTPDSRWAHSNARILGSGELFLAAPEMPRQKMPGGFKVRRRLDHCGWLWRWRGGHLRKNGDNFQGQKSGIEEMGISVLQPQGLNSATVSKSKEMHPPLQPPERSTTCTHLNLSPVRPASDFYLQNCKIIKVCSFKMLNSWSLVTTDIEPQFDVSSIFTLAVIRWGI